MGILEMTSNGKLAFILGIAYYCPDNTNDIKFPFQYVENLIEPNLEIILLGIGGGYLPENAMYEYILKNRCMFDFEIAGNTSSLFLEPNDKDLLFHIKERIHEIDLETWALAFERLFYIAVFWLKDNLDTSIKDCQYVFETLWDDFCFVPVANENLFFPPSPSHDLTKWQKKRFDKKISNWIASNVQKFLKEEKIKLEKEDFHNPEYREDFESILEGWSMRYFEGEIPKIVQEYEKKMNG